MANAETKHRFQRLRTILTQAAVWLAIGLLPMVLLFCCIGSSLISSAFNADSPPIHAADKFLKALQQQDREVLTKMLFEPRKTSELLRRWDNQITVLGALRSWQATHIEMRKPVWIEIEIGRGKRLVVERYPTLVEYQAQFEKSQSRIRINLSIINGEWKVKSFEIVSNML